MPPKPRSVSRETMPPAPLVAELPVEPARQTPGQFMDKLQTAIGEILDSDEVTPSDKLKAIKEGIELAKVRKGIDDDDDGEGMGFPQR